MNEKISKRNLDSSENQDADSSKEERNNLEDEIKKWKDQAENLLRQNKTLFESFSESIIPRLQFSESVLIDFKTMTIHLDTDYFYRKGFNNKQMIWAAYHELSHFRDLISDPKGFMENFVYIKKKAEEYGEEIRKILGVPKEEFSEEEKKEGKIDSCDRLAYESWHTFYNCLDDVYVNSLVERGVPFSFGKNGRHQEEIAKLYREILFVGSDYSKLPQNKQFSYYFLRKAMLPDEDIIVEPEVLEALNEEVYFGGERLRAIDMIERFLKSKTKKGLKAGDRYFIIKKTLEPIFERLYKQDLEDFKKLEEERKKEEQSKGKPEKKENNTENKNQDSSEGQKESGQGKNPKGGEQDSGSKSSKDKSEEDQGSGSNQESENKKSDEGNGEGDESSSESDKSGDESGESGDIESKEGNLDREFKPQKGKGGPPRGPGRKGRRGGGPLIPGIENFNIDDIKDIEKKIKDFTNKDKDLEEERKKKIEEQIQKWCDEHKVGREILREYEDIKQKILPYLNALSKVWESIIFGYGTDIERGTKPADEGNVNVDRFIRYYADILSGQIKEVKPMEKKTLKELPSNRPEVIRVRFVGDSSGSMTSEKRKVLKMVYVLIMSSLRDFETKLNRTRTKTKSKLTVQTEGWIFGSTAQKLKSFRKGRDYEGEFVEIIRELEGLNKSLGSTNDHLVYEKIQEELTPGEINDIRSKKAMDIIFEVTDGGSTADEETKDAIGVLEKEGFIIRAFQIGVTDPSDSDSVTFNYVWNEDESGGKLREQRGFQIGNEIDKLVPAIVGALIKYLSGIKI